MIEIAPIKPLMKEVRSLVRNVNSGVYLAADVITQHKEFDENRAAYALGALLGSISGLIATYGVLKGSFETFCVGTAMAGFGAASRM